MTPTPAQRAKETGKPLRATAGFVEGDGRGAATAADPEGGRGAAAHVGNGVGQVATARSCVSNVSKLSVDALGFRLRESVLGLGS